MAKALPRAAKKPARRPWSKEDFRQLKSMARKESVAKIAKSLKRTVGATRQKATVIGLSLSLTPKKRTTAKKPTAAKKPTVARKPTAARRPTAAKGRTIAKRRTAAKKR
jgi:hypothetical protein